jgi:phosphonate transport system permease protein
MRYHPRKYRPLLAPGLGLGVLIYAAALGCEVSFDRFWKGVEVGGDLLAAFFPPAWGDFGDMLMPALETLLLAVIATPLAVIVSFFVALLAADNMRGGWVRNLARGLMSAERATPMAGIIALALGSIGMLGKLFADAMEEVDPRLLEAMECTGATRSQILRYAILPVVLPSMIANSLFRFEINIRSAALLGMVGAGGIGYELSQAMALLEYPRATVAIAVTLALVFLTERLAGQLRERLISRERLV